MSVRQLIPPPRGLTGAELAQWTSFATDKAAFVYSDSFLHEPDSETAKLCWTAWASIYPLGVILLRALGGRPIAGTDPAKLPSNRHESTLESQILKQAEGQTKYFSAFLEDWGFARYLGTPDRTSIGAVSTSPQTEGKLLGLHMFETRDSIDKYVLLWKTNPLVQQGGIGPHRAIASRCIDLICTELLANAFDHGGGSQVCFDSGFFANRPSLIAHLTEMKDPNWGHLRQLIIDVGGQRIDAAGLNKGKVDASALANVMNEIVTERALWEDEWLKFCLSGNTCMQRYLGRAHVKSKIWRQTANRLVLDANFPAEMPLPRPFILAKQCSVESSAWALELDLRAHHLMEH